MTASHKSPEKSAETLWTIMTNADHSSVMDFDSVTRVLRNSSLNDEVAVHVITKLKRCCTSMSALIGKSLLSSDFKYAVYPDDPRRRQLHMWCADAGDGDTYPTSSMRLHLSATGQIEKIDDLVIILSSTFRPRHHR